MSQLKDLAKPFPDQLIKKAPSGKYGTYVSHSAVTERLLQICGGFDFQLVEVIRGDAPLIPGKNGKSDHPARSGAVVGVVARLTVEVDGRRVVVEEVGTEDNPAKSDDGANLKNAMSDALKRCAMRIGCGLHLWSKDDYYLYARLHHDEKKAAEAVAAAAAVTEGEPGAEPAPDATPEPGREDAPPVEPAPKPSQPADDEFPPEPPEGALPDLRDQRRDAAVIWAVAQMMEIGSGAGKKAVFQSKKKAGEFYDRARQEFLDSLDPSQEIADDDGVLLPELETDIGRYFARKVTAAARGEEYVRPPYEEAA